MATGAGTPDGHAVGSGVGVTLGVDVRDAVAVATVVRDAVAVDAVVLDAITVAVGSAVAATVDEGVGAATHPAHPPASNTPSSRAVRHLPTPPETPIRRIIPSAAPPHPPPARQLPADTPPSTSRYASRLPPDPRLAVRVLPRRIASIVMHCGPRTPNPSNPWKSAYTRPIQG
jgi:hypothetical protein